MQMIYRYLNKQDVLITRIFDGREFDEHYESAVATLPDMEIFIRYIFEKLAGFQHQDNRQESVVEQIKHYINDHLKGGFVPENPGPDPYICQKIMFPRYL